MLSLSLAWGSRFQRNLMSERVLHCWAGHRWCRKSAALYLCLLKSPWPCRRATLHASVTLAWERSRLTSSPAMGDPRAFSDKRWGLGVITPYTSRHQGSGAIGRHEPCWLDLLQRQWFSLWCNRGWDGISLCRVKMPPYMCVYVCSDLYLHYGVTWLHSLRVQ